MGVRQMPGIATSDDFVAVVRKSGLVEEEQLSAYLEQFTDENPLPAKSNQLAGRMVRDGLITKFQAQQLLQGKTRGFVISDKYIGPVSLPLSPVPGGEGRGEGQGPEGRTATLRR